MNDLQQAIEELYRIFSRHPRPTRIVSCPCGCTKPEETAPLLAVPLRALSADDMRNYAFSAMTTQGSVEDFQYFLPRLFEAITKDLDGICAETVFHKLTYAKWLKWSNEEIQGVRTYLDALWRTALSSYPLQEALPPFFEIETVIASIAQTEERLEPFLSEWTETRNLSADLLLLQLVAMHCDEFADGQYPHEAFWKGHDEQARTLRTWLLSPGTMLRIEAAAHLAPTDGFDDIYGLAPALDIFQREASRTLQS